MKRLITILITVFLAVALSAQTSNTFKYEIKGLGGITLGPTATANKATITSAILSGTQVSLYNGATQYSVAVAAADQIDLNTVYVKLNPDSVNKTADFTLDILDANKLFSCVKTGGDKITITIPANADEAIPIGTTINFIQGGTAILGFAEAAGVMLYSKKDSTHTGGIWSWAALYKRGTNNWILYGDILD